LRWDLFRGNAQPHEIDPLALALVAQDLARLNELIGGGDMETIEVYVDSPRPSAKAGE
jgi:hypothetical protein